MKKYIFYFLLILSSLSVSAQDTLKDEARIKKNLAIALGCEAGLYAATMTGLYFTWYSSFPPSSFHFINDNAEWQQMDKVGLGFTAYQVGRGGYEVLRAVGIDEKRAIWFGGTLGIVFQTSIEIFDGFSQG